MKKRNLILILLTLSGIITAFSIVMTNTLNTRSMRELAIKSSSLSLPEETPIIKEEPPKEAVTEPKSVVEEKKSAPTPTPELKFFPPVKGEIITEYSTDVLVFSDVYNDYRTHLGVDIIADSNTPVLAMADGVVTKNYFDYDEGIVIEIEHRDGYVSVYKNLGNAVMAPVGKIVKQGEAISGIGDTGVFESHMPYHLHLEMKKSDEFINPIDIIEN